MTFCDRFSGISIKSLGRDNRELRCGRHSLLLRFPSHVVYCAERSSRGSRRTASIFALCVESGPEEHAP
jgi:hypothetical protein